MATSSVSITAAELSQRANYDSCDFFILHFRMSHTSTHVSEPPLLFRKQLNIGKTEHRHTTTIYIYRFISNSNTSNLFIRLAHWIQYATAHFAGYKNYTSTQANTKLQFQFWFVVFGFVFIFSFDFQFI